MNMFKRIKELKDFIRQMEAYRAFCIAARDAMREENACLAISEAKHELRTLRAQLRK